MQVERIKNNNLFVQNQTLQIKLKSDSKLTSSAHCFSRHKITIYHFDMKRKTFITITTNHSFPPPKKKGKRNSNNENSNNQRHVSTNNTWKLLGALLWKKKQLTKSNRRFPGFPVPGNKNIWKFKNHFSFLPTPEQEKWTNSIFSPLCLIWCESMAIREEAWNNSCKFRRANGGGERGEITLHLFHFIVARSMNEKL